MPHWTIDSPRTVDLGDVAALRVRLISGTVAVLATEDSPALDVTSVDGPPLLVTHEAGILTITYSDLRWDGLRGWLHPRRHAADITVTVPGGCPTQVGVVSAGAIVSGMCAKMGAKSVSGDITLDGVTGAVDAKTVSGNLEARGIDGELAFNSVSGDLTLADSTVRQMDARTVSGRVTADIDLREGGGLRVNTVSGDVAVRVPASCSARVDLRSASGRLATSFDGLGTPTNRGPSVISATIGSGSASLSVASVTGNVTLLARDGDRGQPPGRGRHPAGQPGGQS